MPAEPQSTSALVRPHFPAFLDSTMIRDFRQCPQKFLRTYVQHLRPRSKSIHLHFGGCFAKGLEMARLSFYYENPGDIMLALAKGAEAIIREWGDPALVPIGEDKKNLMSCLDALTSYFIQYPPAVDAVRPWFAPDGKPAVEFSFALPFPGVTHPETGDPILYCGKFDMLAEFMGAKAVLDDKTASQLGDSWLNQWHLRSQLTGYTWAAEEYGHKIGAVLVRGVCILKSDITHSMAIESRPKFQIKRWLEQTRRDIERMISCWKEGYWDYNLDQACDAYGGCPMLKLCTAADPSKFIESEYEVVEPWDPLKADD